MTAAGTSADQAGADDLDEGERSPLRNVVEWVVILVGALVVAFLVKAFLFQAFSIPSGSMEETLQIHDRVLVNKLSYRLHEINRGDVVVFEKPPNNTDPDINHLIKRVMAVEGDTIESRGDTVYLNDKPLVEPYRKNPTLGQAVPKQTIQPGMIWVMGDNRINSSDSRVFGAISENLVVGRAFVRIWPIPSFTLL